MRHYLAHHWGKDRQVAWARVPAAADPARAYGRIMGSGGLIREGSIVGLTEGAPYRIVATTGEVFSGVVCINSPPTDFSGTVDGLNNALLRFVFEMGSVKYLAIHV